MSARPGNKGIEIADEWEKQEQYRVCTTCHALKLLRAGSYDTNDKFVCFVCQRWETQARRAPGNIRTDLTPK